MGPECVLHYFCVFDCLIGIGMQTHDVYSHLMCVSHRDALASFVSAPCSCFLFRLADVQPCKQGSFAEKILLSEASHSWHTAKAVLFFPLAVVEMVGSWWGAPTCWVRHSEFDLLGHSQLGRPVSSPTLPLVVTVVCTLLPVVTEMNLNLWWLNESLLTWHW